MRFKAHPTSPLAKKSRRGFRGYPLATVVFYGPVDKHATKAAVGVVTHQGAEPQMHRLFAEQGDARTDPVVNSEILKIVESNGVKSVLSTEGILGCPHEEGIDYPEGTACPRCPFWAHRNRFTGKFVP